MASRILPLPAQARVAELLNYNPDTGMFTWARSSRGHIVAGKVAGSIGTRGYIKIRIDGISYLAHRIAWLHQTGNDPGEAVIDHIDGNTSNNAIKNLHVVSHKQNAENRKAQNNNTSGYPGVYWHNKAQKWYGRICHDSKHISLGMFADPHEAHLAVEKARQKLFSNNQSRHIN